MSAGTLPTPVQVSPPSPRGSLLAAVELMKTLGRGESVLIAPVSWGEYLWFDAQRDYLRPNVKLVYADGRLEFMATSFAHDRHSRRVHDVVKVVAEELGVVLIAGGGMTLNRDDLESGLQADECFYIQSVEAVRFLDEIDLATHPPPDLAVEVDRTNSSIPKEPIYRRLGVPELWRVEANAVTFRVRQSDGTYADQPNSRAFPLVSSADLTRLVFAHTGLDDITFIRNVRNWVRTLVPPPQP